MATNQLQQQRQAAGAAYAAAAQAYLDAYVELHAHDLAYHGGAGPGFPEFRPPTPHGDFLADPIHGTHVERVQARAEQIKKVTGV
ncbi:hypothetical protein [Variovorax sp. dw_308]|uniref:hypothetical protein n=1 Tax=Variovorax sp. dw_308 TaxID=2721546 RepID=UPI001C450240|nr:hypothetical protein [Variovorax sp. dw_308]